MSANAPPWTQAEINTALSLRNQGRTTREIAAEIGRSFEATKFKLKQHARAAATAREDVPQITHNIYTDPTDALRAKVAALEMQLAALSRREQQPDRVEVTTEAEPPHDAARAWKLAEDENARRIEYARARGRFTATLPAEVCALAFVSDQHIAPGTPVDMRRMREDAELIRDTPGLYVMLGGDGVDNHIKHRAAVMAARSQPHDQYLLFEWYLEILAPKVIAMISGNHDKWTDEIGGVDMLSRIAKSQRLFYAPSEAIGDLQVGEVSYKVGLRHQYRMNSSFNQCHAVKQWFRNGVESWDIGCVCHHHEAAIEAFNGHGLRRWACRPGAYQVTSAYSHQYGFNDSEPTCPTFLLYPDQRRIIGFVDVRDAVKCLRAERAAA